MKNRLASVLTLLGAAVALIAVAAAWLFPASYSTSRVILGNVALVALIAGTGLVTWPEAKPAVLIPWVAGGALLGATVFGASAMAIWVLLAALLFCAAGVAQGLDGRRGVLTRVATTATAAVCNAALLWALVLGRYAPVPPTEFLSHDLRVHSLLSGVPLHDVWIIRLRGGDTPTIEDIRAILTEDTFSQANPIVLGLIAFRTLLGGIFGWDDDACEDSASSYVHRLTDADRRRSQMTPEPNGFIYAFEHEALAEIYNCTVHAFLAWAWKPTADAHDLYWAIYVEPVGDVTWRYMALIDPFRRLFVYPSIIRRIEQRWVARWET
jgi:hypothetical protein